MNKDKDKDRDNDSQGNAANTQPYKSQFIETSVTNSDPFAWVAHVPECQLRDLVKFMFATLPHNHKQNTSEIPISQSVSPGHVNPQPVNSESMNPGSGLTTPPAVFTPAVLNPVVDRSVPKKENKTPMKSSQHGQTNLAIPGAPKKPTQTTLSLNKTELGSNCDDVSITIDEPTTTLDVRKKLFSWGNNVKESKSAKIEQKVEQPLAVKLPEPSNVETSKCVWKTVAKEKKETKSQQVKSSEITGTCIFWLKGHCSNGLSCDFLHELRDCEFWLKGHCNNGTSCNFAHDADKKGTKENGFMPLDCEFWLKGYCSNGKTSTFAHDPEKKGLSQEDCEFWMLGQCNNGKKCTYKHDAKKNGSVKRQVKDAPCSKGINCKDRAKCKYLHPK